MQSSGVIGDLNSRTLNLSAFEVRLQVPMCRMPVHRNFASVLGEHGGLLGSIRTNQIASGLDLHTKVYLNGNVIKWDRVLLGSILPRALKNSCPSQNGSGSNCEKRIEYRRTFGPAVVF
jgi:hypothetical protein